MIILSEIYQRQIACDIICIWNLIKMMDKTETQISKSNLWLPKGKHGGK